MAKTFPHRRPRICFFSGLIFETCLTVYGTVIETALGFLQQGLGVSGDRLPVGY